MREHIGWYRGKRIDNGKWEMGYLFCIWEEAYIFRGTTNGVPNMYEVDPDTIGECTGLKDKNGKLIFEGDILEHTIQADILTNRGVVDWDGKNARWTLRLNTMHPCFYMHNPAAFEIIGNIHDNPELLKGGEG